MKFNSQICTTREQSERLLALGLKKGTADCIWCEVRTLTKGNPIQWHLLAEHINKHDEKHIPAWSLHRLIEILDIWYLDLNFHEFADTYEQVISYFEERVKGGFINKEYLEE